eukprot:2881453-Pleurochrysis_carterae.AAC.1
MPDGKCYQGGRYVEQEPGGRRNVPFRPVWGRHGRLSDFCIRFRGLDLVTLGLFLRELLPAWPALTMVLGASLARALASSFAAIRVRRAPVVRVHRDACAGSVGTASCVPLDVLTNLAIVVSKANPLKRPADDHVPRFRRRILWKFCHRHCCIEIGQSRDLGWGVLLLKIRCRRTRHIWRLKQWRFFAISGRRPCLRRCRSCASVRLGGCVGVRHGREVETGISMFALIVHLVSVCRVDGVDQGAPPRGAPPCALPLLRPNDAAAIAFLSFFVGPLQAAETGTAMCAILTRRIVSSITQLSLPNAFLSNRSRRRARPSPASAAGRNLMMSWPSLSPAY